MTQELQTQTPRIQIQIPLIPKSVSQDFAKQWKYGSIVVTLDDTAFQFATDFINALLPQAVNAVLLQLQNIPQQASQEITPLEKLA